MRKNLENELLKIVKSKRLVVFTGIILALSVFFGMVIMEMGKTKMDITEINTMEKSAIFKVISVVKKKLL